MRNEEVIAQDPAPGFFKETMAASKHAKIALHVMGTLLGALLFAAALLLAGTTHLGMPGHIVVFWMPALMAGRALGGYRGSGIFVGTGGAMLANVNRLVIDGDLLGFVLAAVVVEAVMLAARQNPSVVVAIFVGIAASLGKMIPKVAAVLFAGGTPHHNRSTLPFMLGAYLLFGVVAGVIYAGGRYVKRKMEAKP